MLNDDRTRLRHMLEAAEEAVSFARGQTRESLEQDRMRTHAILRCIQIIGEAAARISEAKRAECAGIP
jgi:uncharacterized protein with HEPN domain